MGATGYPQGAGWVSATWWSGLHGPRRTPCRDCRYEPPNLLEQAWDVNNSLVSFEPVDQELSGIFNSLNLQASKKPILITPGVPCTRVQSAICLLVADEELEAHHHSRSLGDARASLKHLIEENRQYINYLLSHVLKHALHFYRNVLSSYREQDINPSADSYSLISKRQFNPRVGTLGISC